MSREALALNEDQSVIAEYCRLARGQTPIVLTLETDNVVSYETDTPDLTKYATNPNITPAVPFRNFTSGTMLGDNVSINGEPVKGLYTSRVITMIASPTPNPATGGAIADSTHASARYQIFEILKTDSTPIGTIMVVGMYSGITPGSPSGVTGDWAVVGGTGAFLGVRGQMGSRANVVNPRIASVVEEPANRRINGGGKIVAVFTLYPMLIPQVVITHAGPAIHSSDFTLVSESKPISAGEVVLLFMTGLGPTQPGVDPGQPFAESPVQVVNSPIDVRVNGESAEVLEAVGVPGSLDCYRLTFTVPKNTARGLARVQVSVAWIPGTPIGIAIR